MELAAAHRAATVAGLFTVPLGVGLLTRPGLLGGVGIGSATTRVLGATDLVVGTGLLAARPRWPWMVARAAANLPTAAVCLRPGTTAGRAVAAGLLAVTVADTAAALTLRAAAR